MHRHVLLWNRIAQHSVRALLIFCILFGVPAALLAQSTVFASHTLEQPAEQVPAMGELETPRGREALIPVIDFQKMPPEKAVLAAYAKLERLIRASGAEISIELSEIAVWDRSQFDTLTWASIAEYPQDGGIQVARIERTHGDGRVSLEYKPRWTGPDRHWFHLAESFRNDQRSIAEVLEEAGTVKSYVLWFDRLVTFEVDVMLEGRHRKYDAGMFLLHDDEGINTLHPVDYVLDRVDSAVAEEPTLLTDEVVVDSQSTGGDKLAEALGDGWQSAVGSHQKNSCLSFSQAFTQRKSQQGSNDHISGFHVVEAEFEHTCSCNTSCTSSCVSGTVWEQCWDTGTTSGYFCHKLSSNGSYGDNFVMGGAASCGSGVGCSQVSCSTPFCGLCDAVGVSVNGGPVSFSLSVGGGASWSRLIQSSATCAACPENPDGGGDDTPPNDGGDPSNGGSGNPPSPILIALEPGQFSLTGLDDPVTFDIDADGYPETIGWSTRDGDEAFLVLDRDGNGSIDDGSELFGNYTEQPESPEPNGFLALAAFDDSSLGGNADGEISAEDAVFAELRLWHDIDHDGISDPNELEPLAESGILSISLSPVRSERRDRHGNLLRYASHVRFASGPQQRLAAVDVFFVAEDGP